ncbi:unnamed protein product [Toxocara canis]|uniref:Uncharacterized protein n=1 Tax=Toxocara canis TaxID=6265 RepID=A0A183VD63_TOXCA|nr:unnamed protein product [Toxocara canis]
MVKRTLMLYIPLAMDRCSIEGEGCEAHVKLNAGKSVVKGQHWGVAFTFPFANHVLYVVDLLRQRIAQCKQPSRQASSTASPSQMCIEYSICVHGRLYLAHQFTQICYFEIVHVEKLHEFDPLVSGCKLQQLEMN